MRFRNTQVVAIGEAMVEMAPVSEGLFRRGFAGDTFNTVWHMAQVLGSAATCGFVTRGLYLIELDGVERRFHYWREAS